MSLEQIYCSAAEKGHSECLRYRHENGCRGIKILVLLLPKRSPRVFEIRTRTKTEVSAKFLGIRILVLLLPYMVTSSV